MGRVLVLTGALMACSVTMWIRSGFVGAQGMLTMELCIGAGAAAALLLVGVILGAVGFLLRAAAFPGTPTSPFLGAFPPAPIGLTAMWTKRLDCVIAALIGAGALVGLYANDLDLDPQAINISLLIALGVTLLPLGLGYLAGLPVRSLVPDDPSHLPTVAERAAVAATDETAAAPGEGNR